MNSTQRIQYAKKERHFLTDEELMALPVGSVFTFDVECYFNMFYVAFKLFNEKKYVAFERSPAGDFNVDKLKWLLWRFTIVGFNSRNYDLLIIEYACIGATCEQLKEASDFIIKSGPQYNTPKVTPYGFEKKYKVNVGNYNHIDLIEVAPLQGSLKLYAGRMHAERMQDLPFDESHILTADDAEIIRDYCPNDLDNTELLFMELASEIKLRGEMSKEYGVDLRSKSDAQVAEAVINKELEKVLGYYPKKVDSSKIPNSVKFEKPDFIQFRSPALNNALSQIVNAEFELDGLGSPLWPKGLGEVEREKNGTSKWVLKVKIGKSYYKIGMGGLHSNEKKIAHHADENTILADNDVESFYPRTILNQELFPPHLGRAFLTVYNAIVERRLHAKGQAALLKKTDKEAAKGFKTIADSLKITINGSFGKLGNKYSTLYAPQLMLQVTITGQLVLLMLIEALESIGIEVVSANTDGIILKYHKDRHAEVRAMIASWEAHTNYKTEETQYKAVYSRDVNNYMANKGEEEADESSRYADERLGFKAKGTYCERGSALNSILSKNPQTLICAEAVMKFLKQGTPIDATIRQCTDIRRFVTVRNVKGGGVKNGVYLGKVVRWYYAKDEHSAINYLSSGNKVSKSQGGVPLMELPSELPSNIDYDWYVDEATAMLYDCGRFKELTTKSLF